MDEKTAMVFELITKGIPLDEIEKSLKLEVKEFSSILKTIRDLGYNFTRTINFNGKVILKLNKTLHLNPAGKIKLIGNERLLRVAFLSDLHTGNVDDCSENWEIALQYAKNHNINIVIIAGDIIENVYEDSPAKLRYNTSREQIEYFVQNFPHHPSITSLLLYGNHDYRCILNEGFDIARYIESVRYDLISLGYGSCVIQLKNDLISVVHDLTRSSKKSKIDASIFFKGHSHKAKNSYKDEKVIYLPALSNLRSNAYEFAPLTSFIDAEFNFFAGKIERVNTRQLAIIDREIRLANEEAIILSKKPIPERKKY